MIFDKVQPANRQGAWEVEGFGYRSEAKIALRRYEEVRTRLNHEVHLLEEARKSKQSHRVPQDVLEEYRLLRTATVVFAAMAVESFLNYYGVKRLGEEFYRENYERLSTTQKVAALVATCAEQLLRPDSELLEVTKRLARARNQLVHPKAREPKPNQDRSLPHPDIEHPDFIHASVKDMDRFFTLFGEIDPQAIGTMPW
jgi:hypothetical protein